MLRYYNLENRAYLCRPFMPQEVVQYTRPYIAPPITNLAGLWGVTPFQAPLPASRVAIVPALPPASDQNLPPAVPAATEAAPQ